MTLLSSPRLIGLALLATPTGAGAPPCGSEGAPPLAAEPMQPGPFAPTWDSPACYQVPHWFRDAKIGIWAHWAGGIPPSALAIVFEIGTAPDGG